MVYFRDGLIGVVVEVVVGKSEEGVLEEEGVSVEVGVEEAVASKVAGGEAVLGDVEEEEEEDVEDVEDFLEVVAELVEEGDVDMEKMGGGTP